MALNIAAVQFGETDDVPNRTREAESKYANNPFVKDVRASFAQGKMVKRGGKEVWQRGKAKFVELPRRDVPELLNWLRNAATQADLGISFAFRWTGEDGQTYNTRDPLDLDAVPETTKVTTLFYGKPPRNTKKRREAAAATGSPDSGDDGE